MIKKLEPTGERLTEFTLDTITLEHLHRYAIALDFSIGKKVLDIACGEGYGSFLLAKKASMVNGVDIDKNCINYAGAKYKLPNLAFSEGEATSIPLPANAVDLIVSFETIEHLENQETMLAEMKRVLNTGGLVLISTPDKLYYSDKAQHVNPFHKKELYRDEFEILIRKYFKNLLLLSQRSGLFSLITSAQTDNGMISYNGDFSGIEKENGLNAPFLLAIASDGPLPVIPASIFGSDNMLSLLLQEHSDAIRKTASYKIGNFLLTPFKFVRSLFSSGNKKRK